MIKRLALLAIILGFALAKTIQMDVNEEKLLIQTGTSGIIVINNPDVLQLSLKASAVSVKALKPGQATFIVIIDKEKVPLRVVVAPVKIAASQPTSILDYSGKVFATNLSIGYGSGQSSSIYPQYQWTYGYTFYRLKTMGETPWGFLTNQVYYKNRIDVQGLNAFYVSLKNQYGLLAFGDQYLPNQSSIFFPAQPLQGLSYEGMLRNFEIFLFAGSNNYGSWGAIHEFEQRAAQNISHAKVMMKVDQNSAVGATMGNRGASLLGKTRAIGVDLDGEFASDTLGNQAKEATARYAPGTDLSWTMGYRDYQPSFSIPVGMVNYGGYQGMWYNLNYQPRDYLAIDYNGQNYRRNVLGQTLPEKGNQLQISLLGGKFKEFLPDLIVQVWDNQSAGASSLYTLVSVITSNTYVTPNMGVTPTYTTTTSNLTNAMAFTQSGAMYTLRKHLPWYNVDVWGKWVPQQVVNQQNSAYSYDKLSRGVGVRVPLFDELLTYQGEVWSEGTQYTNSANIPENVYRYVVSLRPQPVWGSDLLFNTFYQFDSRQNQTTLESFVKHFYKLELQWIIGPDKNLSVATYRTIDDMPATYQLSRILDELRVEYSQNFNWRVNWEKGKSIITGMVYKDENNNATLEDTEKGVANVSVTLSDGRSTTTNGNGVYRFENVTEGPVLLDLDTAATKMTVTDDLPKAVQVEANERYVVNVGVILNDRVMGYVFADENQNGFRDPKEKGFKDVRLIIGDTVVKTDENGYYEFVSPEYGGKYVVVLDMSSLPDRYKLLGDRKQSVAGSSEVSFILEPINKQAYKDDYLEVEEIKPIGKTELSITGRLLKPIFYAIINDQKVNLESEDFQVSVPRKGNEVKFKFYTRDKTFWIKMVPFK